MHFLPVCLLDATMPGRCDFWPRFPLSYIKVQPYLQHSGSSAALAVAVH